MKKLLLGFAALSLAASTQAQRLSLYEEFSGENCGPCAASNPALNTLLFGNSTKVILIKYQSPIPSAGPIYTAYTTVTQARLSYYSVPFAPYGRLNGTGLGTGTAAPGSPGHVANLTQADINAAYAVATPFNLSVSHTWNAAGDSVTANVNIAALTAYAPTGANVKLRIALIEHLQYCTAPGSNGETEFHNVVREMYPDAAGTQLANAWTAGQTQTLTIKGKVPTRVDKTNDRAVLVVWIQNDGDKSIPMAAESTLMPLVRDASIKGCAPGATLTCASGSTTTLPNSVVLKNTGSTAITSATIYYKVDNGAYTSYGWTGNLAAGASTTVTIPAATLTTGFHQVTDSIGTVNGSADINTANNNYVLSANVYSSTGAALPISTGFENAGALPANWILYDANGNSQNWQLVSSSTGLGHGGSTYMLRHYNYLYTAGETNYAILPSATLPTGNRTLEFWVAYAQYAAENDKLEVVYSTNCGTSWTSVWSAAGAALATHAPVGNNVSYVPAAADWRLKSIAVNSIPVGAMIALRATSDYGNNLYVDDINLRSGTPVGVQQITAVNDLQLAPNPAQGLAVLSFNLAQPSTVMVQVMDAVGRVVATPVNGSFTSGQQHVTINTENIPAGIYNVVVRTGEGARTERLTVVK